MAEQHLPKNWIQKVMVLLSIPDWSHGDFPHQVVRFFQAWERCEGGEAEWNPLNTTNHIRSAEGQWQGQDYNNVGVCNYQKPFYGIVATAATLLSGYYDSLVGALRTAKDSGVKAEALVRNHESEIKTWGTNPSLMLEVLRTIP